MPAKQSPVDKLMKGLEGYLRAWQKLLIKPVSYFQERTMRKSLKAVFLESLPFVLVAALLSGFLSHKVVPGLIFFACAYLGLALLSLVERYILLFFNENLSFRDAVDFIFGLAPAMLLAWIPAFGLPACLVLAGFWNFLGLKHQIKIDPNAALAAAGLPVFLTGVLMFALIILVGPWIGAMQSLSGL